MQLILIYTTLFTKNLLTLLFRLSVMPTKDLAPFSYYIPTKNPLFNDKV